MKIIGFFVVYLRIINKNFKIMDTIALKRQAKADMKGGWAMAIVAAIIFVCIMSLASFTYLGVLLITGPMSYGFFAFIANKMTYNTTDLNLLFVGFKNRFAETLVAGLVMTILTAVGAMLLIVPGIIIGCGLSMTYLIMLDNPSMSGIDALKASWALMKGHKWDYFVLGLSFIGWIILSVFTLGLLMVYITPYMYATYVAFYRQISTGSSYANTPFSL